MDVFKISQTYRDVGMNYGLPVHVVEYGFGASYTPPELLKTLVTRGLSSRRWLILTSKPLIRRGLSAFVSLARKASVIIEIEEDGKTKEPTWAQDVDRWVVYYKEDALFNYGCLRPKRDVVLYEGSDPQKFVEATSTIAAIRALVVADRKSVWDLVKNTEVRVYERHQI